MTDLSRDEVLQRALAYIESTAKYLPHTFDISGLELVEAIGSELARAPLVADNAALTEAKDLIYATLAQTVVERDALKAEIEGWKKDPRENLESQCDLQAQVNALKSRVDAANALHHETLDKLHQALARAEAAEAELARMKAGEPIAWCELSLDGKHIAYFDGKPVIMVGPIGNDCHKTPLYTSPQPSAVKVVREMVEALSRSRIMAADADGNYTREVTPKIITAALAAGQRFVKESGE